MTRTARWLDLIAYLLGRHSVSRAEIYRNVRGYLADPQGADDRERESARRKFERDKDELRTLGIKIETVQRPMAAGTEDQQGYRLKAGDFYLPYLEIEDGPVAERPYQGLQSISLTRQDLEVLDRGSSQLAQRAEFPLAKAAASARRKLAFDLPITPAHVERILAEPMSDETEGVLALLQDAVARHVAVRCRYYSIGRDVEEERELEPQGLYFNWGRWYCVATPRRSFEFRVFRVDRIKSADLIPLPEGQFYPNPKFSIRQFLGRSPWHMGEGEATPVRVRIRYPEYRWVMARGLGYPVSTADDREAELEFQVRDEPPFLRWLLTLRDRARVVSPNETAAALEAMRQEVAALYA